MALVRRRYVKGAAVSVGAFLLFGGVTGLIPNPIYTRMVPRTPPDYLFLALTAVLLGVYTAQRVPAGERHDGVAAVGTVGGFLAFGCPICNAFLLALFSSSALMTYFDPLRPYLGVVAVVLLAGLVYYRHTRACAACRVDGPGEASGDGKRESSAD
jgi:predicted transporter